MQELENIELNEVNVNRFFDNIGSILGIKYKTKNQNKNEKNNKNKKKDINKKIHKKAITPNQNHVKIRPKRSYGLMSTFLFIIKMYVV